MKLRDVIAGLKIKEINASLDIDIKGVCYHSRECKKGFAYFVRKGLKYNGYDFVHECVEKGVSVFFGEESVEGYPFVIVEDIAEAQATVSSNFYGNPQNSIKIIGVTGTNGKTTTAYLLKKALNAGLISTIEIITGKRREKARLTTPESTDIFAYLREMVDVGYRYAVLEVSSHALSLKRVFNLSFDSVVFTSFSRDHLDYYKTMDNYLNAKLKIFSMLKECGFCVLNSDMQVFDNLKGKCSKVIKVGKNPAADIVIQYIETEKDGLSITYKIEGKESNAFLPMIGDYNAYNLGFVLGVLNGLNIDKEGFLKGIRTGFSVPGRVERIDSEKGFSVIIDFAHTPDGLKNLLSSVKSHCEGRVITVFGCGGDRDRTKRPLMLEAVCRYSDLVFVTADNPRTEPLTSIFGDIKRGETFNKEVVYIEDRREAIFKAVEEAQRDDIVVVAGKGHEEYQIIGEEKIPFSDREVVTEALDYES